jgi:hypothetical protein
MQILKTLAFCSWADEVNLNDKDLVKAIAEMVRGLHNGNLGGHIYKKRISFPGRGKSGSARTIVAFKAQGKAIFLYGFAKNKRENITRKEEVALKYLAKTYFSDNRINQAIEAGELIEVQL